MAFFAALGAAAQGYEQGKNTRQDRQQAQQDRQQEERDRAAQLAYQQQRSSEEATTFQQGQDDRKRNQGIDPATGQKFVLPPALTQILPKNGGKGQPTLQDFYNHYTGLQAAYTANGQTDLAAIAGQRAADVQRQMIQQNTLATRTSLDEYNQGQADQRTAETIAGALQRTGMTTDTSRANNENTVDASIGNNIRTTDTSRANNQNTVGGAMARTQAQINATNARHATDVTQRYMTQSATDMRSMQHIRQSAIDSGAADPFPRLDDFNTAVSGSMQELGKHPEKLPEVLQAIDSSTFSPQLKTYAHRVLQGYAKDLKVPPPQRFAPVQGGGSQAAPPFPGQ